MAYRVVRNSFLIMLYALLSLLFCNTVFAQVTSNYDVTTWEYRWGDSLFTEGKPDWVLPENTDDGWQTIAFPSNPPNRSQREFVWFRARLTEVPLHEPVLYIYSVDLITQVYLDANKIYQFGDFSGEEKGGFAGWPWHMIELPENYADQYIYFRVFSNYTDIGLWGEVKLFEKTDLLHYIITTSYQELLIALFCVFVAMLAFAFAIVQKENRHFLFLGGFSLMTAISLLAENQAVQLIFDYPLLRTYLAAAAYFSMPIFIGLLLSQWSSGFRQQLMRKLAYSHIGFLLGAIGLSLAGVFHIASCFPVFDGLFAVTLSIMLLVCMLNARHMKLDQQWVMATFTILALLLLIDMLVAHGLLPWRRVDVSLGALLFSLVLVMISLRQYSRVQTALRELNEHLEIKVKERTATLHAYAETEQERASQLERLNTFSFKLEDLNSQLQACQSLKEAGIMIQNELPKVFEPIVLRVVLEAQNSATNAPFLRQIHLQELEGGSTVFASLIFDANDDTQVLSDEIRDDFITRTTQRLSTTLSSIKLREDLQRFSFEDALTGLKNRRFFDESLQRDIQISQRDATPLSLLICDIDHFKNFNDEYGHEAGDVALKAVSNELHKHFRESDVPCRFGGEEFVVLLRDASLDDAMIKAETLREDIAKRTIQYQGKQIGPLTISIGVATWSGNGAEPHDLLREADKALYLAKQHGRNRVEHQQL